MIAHLTLALQLAAAAPGVLSVRAAGRDTSVPLVPTSVGAAVPIERLAPAVSVKVERRPNAHWAVHVAGVDLDVIEHVPYVKADGEVIPLAAAPFVQGGRLVVPLQVVTELLPRLAPDRLSYDSSRGELRVIGGADAIIPASTTAPRRAASAPRGRATRAHRRVVVVDAGHGGPDNGMTGPIGTSWKIYEKDITLAVAKRLRTALRDRGVDVVMTRTTDTLIALSDRGRIANEHHGDLFVSIHVNAANPNWRRPGDARGYETYFLAEAKTEDAKRVADMENASVRFETSVQAEKDDPLNFIINDMAQNEHLRESSELAETIQAKLGAIEPGPSRGVKQAGFRVLVTAYMPAVLVEIGFGTNPDDARFISSPTHQREIANAIADATIAYLDRYERRLGAATP
ncbi:MAG: N-acetylmuramoyl-L-alanine amidase [Gemmatimonadaceae bacterium]|nr:N-acetylmuramoyl-L-alanine amidase [Gemmatimonadaceae bacterium]